MPFNKLYAGGRHDISPPLSLCGRRSAWRRRAHRNFPRRIRSHADRCSCLTRLRPRCVKRPWKWCQSHVWRGLGYLRASFGLPIGLFVLDLGPMYATNRRQRQTDVR